MKSFYFVIQRSRHRSLFLLCSVMLVVCILFLLDVDVGKGKEPSPAKGPARIVIGRNMTSLCDHVLKTKQDGNASCKQQFPSAIIVGIAKCGTMALMTFLDIHPDIVRARCPPQYQFFRTHYFRGVEFHRRQMPCAKANQVIVEKSPTYFFMDKEVPERIKALDENMKLIVIVRNPLTRAVSSFLEQRVARRIKDESFERVIFCSNGTISENCNLVKHSIYHVAFGNWLRSFPLKQIHVVDGDKFSKNPLPELKKVETFLGLKSYISEKDIVFSESKGAYCIRSRDHKGDNKDDIECLGSKKARKHPTVDPKALQELNAFLTPHKEIFYKMVRRRFDWQ